MDDLDSPYQRLAALPRALWLPGVVNSAGAREARLADLRVWLDALLRGELPPPHADWADPAALLPLRTVVGELELPALARGTPALAEQVLRTLLWHLDRIALLQPQRSRADAIEQVSEEFRDAWTIEKAGLDEALALLRGWGDLAELRWDALRGQLGRREWREAARLDALLRRLHPLVELIASLGRQHREPARPRRQPQPRAAMPTQTATMLRETRLPDAPGELRGIRFSDRLERMLGSEAAQITHPVLHKLWRAHLAESRLLTYHSEAVLLERVPDASARARPAPAAAQDEALARGPILLAIDTSGSMKGAPENVAKAVALQALRTAHRERRRCLLLAFGGPGEIVERELALDAGGLEALLDLIGQSFDGGTDIAAPIERAVELVQRNEWASADLLIVSDGEFGCTPEVLARLDAARSELAFRVQGLLIGDRETMGLLDVADDVFWLRDWRRYAHHPAQAASGARDAGFTPVHSQSLTALYFPNALSERARSRRPG